MNLNPQALERALADMRSSGVNPLETLSGLRSIDVNLLDEAQRAALARMIEAMQLALTDEVPSVNPS